MSEAKRGRGRPRKAPGERAAHPVNLRVYAEDVARLERLTAATGDTVSEIVRRALEQYEAMLDGER
jgi:predicted DNA-binding protein